MKFIGILVVVVSIASAIFTWMAFGFFPASGWLFAALWFVIEHVEHSHDQKVVKNVIDYARELEDTIRKQRDAHLREKEKWQQELKAARAWTRIDKI